MEVVNLIKIDCKHICKCHSEISRVQLVYTNNKKNARGEGRGLTI
jgi:hypothetical protein